MAAPLVSSYLKHLPPVLWAPAADAGHVDLGAMLCVFEKILTGIDDGRAIGHGDNAVLTTVIQSIAASPLPQTVRVTAGTGAKFRVDSSYTCQGAKPEVIKVTATTANTVSAVFRQDHAAYQALVASTGNHPDIQSTIASLSRLYGAWTVPAEAFDWLAQWVALQDDPIWDEYQRRAVLSKIVGIYGRRGTKRGFDEFLEVYALARQRPRVMVDNASKILFCKPVAGRYAATPALVSQRPLVAPQCIAIDAAGDLLVGDLGSHDATIPPAVWRLSTSGDYDHAAGPSPSVQPFQTATAPIAIAADPVHGGAYLIDLIVDYALRRFTAPVVATITLTGTPTPADSGTFSVGGVAYTLAQSGGPALATQATAWAAALNLAAPFNSRYVAAASGPVITLTVLAGRSGDDLLQVTTSSPALQMTATGPALSASTVFATNAGGPPPPLGLVMPRAMVVNAAGQPLILDRGATLAAPSATAVVEVQISAAPTYTGALRHALPAMTEALCLLLRADGSLVVGDGASQISAAPADLWAVNTATWTAASLLGGVAPADNPLVAPVGIVEVDAGHLLVLDAGLRPYVPSAVAPFTAVIARQAAVYSVDLTRVPPVIARVSTPGAGVYPRAMVRDAGGTLYICDSGLPDLAGYSARLWRSKPQQMAVVAHFQGNPAQSMSALTLSGVPTGGNTCSVALGAATFALPETGGDTLPQQAQGWAATLNASAAFNGLYVALPIGNVVCLYAAAQSSPSGVTVTAVSSPSVTLSAGRLAATVSLGGAPTTGNHVVMNVAGSAYVLVETTGKSLAQQAADWATTLNAAAPFDLTHTALATDAVLSIYYRDGDVADNLPSFFTHSATVFGNLTTPPLAIGTLALAGTPTGGETCTLKVGPVLSFALAETGGFTLAQQAEAWAAVLSANASFAANYAALHAGAALMLFAGPAVGLPGRVLAAVGSAHLTLQPYSENQNRARFLQSIRDVVADEVPAHGRWFLQSEVSQS